MKGVAKPVLSKPLKLALTIAFIAIAAATLATVRVGRMYPVLPVILGLGTLVLVCLFSKEGVSNWFYLLPFIIVSVYYRVFVLVTPASFTGADSDLYGFYITKILLSGRTSSLDLHFYSDAPNYLILGAESVHLTGLRLHTALVTIPIVLGVLFPVLAYILGRELPGGEQTGLIASAITVMAPVSVWFSLNPVAQSLGDPLLAAALLAVILYLSRESKRLLLIAFIPFVAVLFTHKLPTTLFLFVFIGATVIWIADPTTTFKSRSGSIPSASISLILIAAGGVGLQWIITTVDRTAVYTVLSLIIDVRPDTNPVIVAPANAERIFDNWVGVVLLNVGYQLPLFLFGLVGWIHLWRNYRDIEWIRTLLATISVSVILYMASRFGVLSITPSRFLLISIPFFAAVIALLVWNVIGGGAMFSPQWRIVVAAVMIICLIGGQAASQLGPRDSPLNGRVYLTEDEVAAKSWGFHYVQGPIHTDDFYANEIPPSDLSFLAATNQGIPAQYVGASPALLDGTLEKKSYCVVAIRGIDKYRGWRLTYDPFQQLRSLNQVYSNGDGVRIFHRDDCINQVTEGLIRRLH